MKKCLSALLVFIFSHAGLHAQEDSTAAIQRIPSGYLDQVSSKAGKLEQQLDKKTEKALAELKKQEEKIRKKLQRKDSLIAASVFAGAENKYKELEQRLQNTSLKQYIPSLDSLSTSLKFLQLNPQLLSQAKEAKEKLDDALSKVKGLEKQFQKADELKRFLKERKQLLYEQLDRLGLTKQLKKLNKQAYYYAQQANEYKTILNDPKKIEKKALELLSKTKFFQDFFRKNSMLASLFRMPGDPNDPAAQANLAGLQTRSQVNALIQNQLTGPNAQQQFTQNIQAAQAQLNQLKDKVLKFGGSSSEDIMPEGFHKNDQKTKSFLKRLEYGANMQSQKATNYFVASSDIGLSLGYKLNDKSIVGVGASFKMGWGTGWRNIHISSQGLGLRSYLDYKLKGSLWISCGYEMNYRSVFSSIAQLQNYSSWQQSGLLGVSKVVSIKSKLFKKPKLMLLWDMLSYRQVPRTQPIVFRIGYNLK
jgi:hypothetical protein